MPNLKFLEQGCYIIFWWKEIALGDIFLNPGEDLGEKEYYSKLIEALRPAINFYANEQEHRQEQWEEWVVKRQFEKWITWMNIVFTKWLPNNLPPSVPVTVVVCTHNRSSVLQMCLELLTKQVCKAEEIIVIDNAPADDFTQRLVFFSDSFTGTSNTFRENAQIFSKVYFPRIIMPVSVISTQIIRFLIQLILFLLVIGYYFFFQELQLTLNKWLLVLPLTVVLIGAIALGMGLLFSVLTAKYRDMNNLVAFGVRLLMFVTPVIYPLEAISAQMRWIVQINPLTPLFELFRLSLLGKGFVNIWQLLYSLIFTAVVLIGAMLFFNKKGDKLIDVV